MRVDAIYEDGRLLFDRDISSKLKRRRFPVRVELPDDVLVKENPKESTASDDPWLTRLEEIRQKVLDTPVEKLPRLGRKDKEYMQAFLQRDDV